MLLRRALLASTLILSIIAVALAATGGFVASMNGIRVSARSPTTAAAAAAAAAIVWLAAAWRAGSVTSDLRQLDAWIDRRSTWFVAGAAGVAGAVAARYGTFSASGADASGYLSQAVMLASGALARREPLSSLADWPGGASSLVPLGWQLGGEGAQVPTYPVGLPSLMAVPHLVGGTIGASLVVCFSAVAVVWCAGQLARTLGGGGAGILAAVWTGTMPVALYASLQPMSDLPVTAAWVACWWVIARGEQGSDPFSSHSPFGAGIAAAVAVLIRPNLAPLAAIPALVLLRRRGARCAAAWAAPVAVAGAVLACLHWRWYGSPLRSGYGSASEIFSVGNVSPNMSVYLHWLVDTHSPLLLAAPVALLVVRRSLLAWMLAFAALVCAAYFLYGVFESWPYLRFLLPALVIAAIAASAGAMRAMSLITPARPLGLVILALAVSGTQIASARELHVLGLADRHARAALAGRYLAAALDAEAVLLSGEQSGAMRYYTGRSIVRWELLDATALAAAQERLAAAGFVLWVVLDDWEVALVRDRFPALALDWPPVLDAGVEGRTRAWRLRDRIQFAAGARVITDRVR